MPIDDGRGGGRDTGQRNSSSTTTTNAASTANETTIQQVGGDQSTAVSEITERGSQNGRSFGRGAYGA